MQTLKFKIQLTITLFTAVSHCSGPLREQKPLAQQGQKVMLVRCDCWFLYFCGLPIVTVIMIDSSKTCKSLVGVEVQSPCVIERCSNIVCYVLAGHTRV